jgi:TonB-linked SusC/RagA family outer membrane protein
MKKKNHYDGFGEQLPNLRKILMIMKLTSFLFLLGILNVMAEVTYSQATKVSLNLKGSTVEEVLNTIENNSEFYFLLNQKLIDVSRKVDVVAENKPIKEVLDKVFEGTDVTYCVLDRQIILYSKSETNAFAQMQQFAVSGKVTSASTGEPLPGVTIVMKGTTQGTITDTEGKYTIAGITPDAILVFSFVGLKTKEIAVGGRTKIDLAMEEEVIGIEEVVAIGYGTMKKRDLTGSISSISEARFQEQPITDFGQVLQGRAAGVSVTNSSGAPGYGTKIRIRGANSINASNDPLYVIDGVPVESVWNTNFLGINPSPSDIASLGINPSDIKSIEILKDASSTAIYGSRGANGVILITTKRGDINNQRIVISSNVSVGKLARKYDLLNAADYASLVNKIYNAEMYTTDQIESFRTNGGTDWQNEIFRTSVNQNHQVSVSGGEGKVRYFLSGNFVNESGILKNTNSDRFSFRSNLDINFSKRFSMNMDINTWLRNTFNADLGSGIGKTNPILQALMWSPTVAPYNADGSYTNMDPVGALGRNPVVLVKEPFDKIKRAQVDLTSNLKYKISNALDVVCNLSAAKYNLYDRLYQSVYIQSTPYLELNSGDGLNWQLQTLLNFNKTIMGKHNFYLTAAFEESDFESRAMNLAAIGAKSPTDDISSTSSHRVNQEYFNKGLMSYFGRLNYNFNSKYYIIATYRADGSSVFRKGNKFSYFPSVGLSWVLSEEEFIKKLNIFDLLKLRGGWGIIGNQSGIPPYIGLNSLNTRTYDWGTTSNYAGYEPGAPANTKLRWEKTTQKNIGMDAYFLNSRLNVSIDYFQKETNDAIIMKSLPLYDGGYDVWQNLGQIDNKGFEFSADYRLINRNNFSWDIGFNLSSVKNKVVKLGTGDDYILTGYYGAGILSTRAFIIKPGYPLGSFYGPKYLELWKVDEAAEALKFGNHPGDSKYQDLNGDYVINSSDYQVTGDANPDFTFGINNTFYYKNFTLNILIDGVQGNQVLNILYAAAAVPINDSRTITLKEGADVWTPSNQNASFPALSSTNINDMNSSRWLQDGSFIKVRNISLSYNLPKRVAKVADLKISLSGQNLLTITKYKGYDPEVSNGGSYDAESGIDMGAYPLPRFFTTQIVLTF